MGVNNKQRRAAKERKRRQRSRRDRQQAGPRQEFGPGAFGDDGAWAYGVVELHVTRTVRRLLRRSTDDAGLLARAASLVEMIRPQPRELLEVVLADLLTRLAEQVARGGWGVADLEQLVARNAGDPHLAMLRAVLDEGTPVRLDTVERVASGLAVAAQLAGAPLLEESADAGRGAPDRSAEHPKLAQVRALLAKAESTEFDEEADALTAKAQELISRYALERLLEQGRGGRPPGDGMAVRRVWLDAPYVRAKAGLVHEVASANRCRAAAADALGFSVVVGAPPDLDAVELLVTSLLVQADTAMLRQGRRVDGYGRSRTRSFRQSFLSAYAFRIGERLRTATTEAVGAGDANGLLPVLRDHETRVADAFDAMVPHTAGRGTSVTDGEGWAAGEVAADLALLDVNGRLAEHAG